MKPDRSDLYNTAKNMKLFSDLGADSWKHKNGRQVIPGLKGRPNILRSLRKHVFKVLKYP